MKAVECVPSEREPLELLVLAGAGLGGVSGTIGCFPVAMQTKICEVSKIRVNENTP